VTTAHGRGAEAENWRWTGVLFFLRSGKRLGASRQLITLGFHEPALRMFPIDRYRNLPGRRDNTVIDFAMPDNPPRSPLLARLLGTEVSSRMACACPRNVTLTQPRNHRDPVTASHLTGGKPGTVGKARTAARYVLRDPREIP
jgi:Glucose-6-phosphate dehydrogenase, C-terminal domain